MVSDSARQGAEASSYALTSNHRTGRREALASMPAGEGSGSERFSTSQGLAKA